MSDCCRSPLSIGSSFRYVLGVDTGDLTIKRAVFEDSAEYVCRAYNGVGESDFLYTKLLVTGTAINSLVNLMYS